MQFSVTFVLTGTLPVGSIQDVGHLPDVDHLPAPHELHDFSTRNENEPGEDTFNKRGIVDLQAVQWATHTAQHFRETVLLRGCSSTPLWAAVSSFRPTNSTFCSIRNSTQRCLTGHPSPAVCHHILSIEGPSRTSGRGGYSLIGGEYGEQYSYRWEDATIFPAFHSKKCQSMDNSIFFFPLNLPALIWAIANKVWTIRFSAKRDIHRNVLKDYI